MDGKRHQGLEEQLHGFHSEGSAVQGRLSHVRGDPAWEHLLMAVCLQGSWDGVSPAVTAVWLCVLFHG